MRNAAIGLALFAAVTASPALAQTSGWQVSEVSGDVRAVVNGESRPVTRGMLLASGSTVASGARARAVLVSGRDYVILSPASRVRLPGNVQQASGGNWAGQMTQIVSEAGTSLYRIERRPNPHFRVQTPYLAAVVKGTVFSVTVSSSGASVQVTEGAVEVSTVDGGAAQLVRPGMVATVEAGDLMQLNIQGEVSRSIRSGGTPLPGVATVPVADAGRYEGASEPLVEITAAVREDPVSLSDATDGLVSGQSGVDLALADLRDETRPVTGTPAGDGNNGHGNDAGGVDVSNPGNGADNGGGNDNSGSGNNNGNGNGGGNDNGGPGNNNGNGNGNGGGNDNSGPGNNNGGGNGVDNGGGNGADNGGGNDNSGPGNNNGGGNDDAGNSDDGNNGHGNDDDGNDASNPGHGGDNSGHGNGGGNDDDDGGNAGNGNGGGNGNSGPGNNNGGGNDDDGDDGNSGNGNGGGHGNGNGNGNGGKPDRS